MTFEAKGRMGSPGKSVSIEARSTNQGSCFKVRTRRRYQQPDGSGTSDAREGPRDGGVLKAKRGKSLRGGHDQMCTDETCDVTCVWTSLLSLVGRAVSVKR